MNRMNISDISRPSGPKINRTDRILLILLLLVYSIVAFVNLGTTVFPETVWKPELYETAIIDLGEERHVAEMWLNGNIAEGTLQIYDDDDQYTEFKQDFGDMFKWKNAGWESKGFSMDTHYIRLFVSEDWISLNEVAFFDENGNRIDAKVYIQADANGKDQFPQQQHLMDEQDTVPAYSSYLNGMYFDEIYHARTAYEVVTDTDLYWLGRSAGVKDFSFVQDNGYTIYEWTHPQLGKVLIALGIRIFGMNPFGWRFTGTLFGVLILWVLYILAKRIFRRSDFALLTAGLFAADCMHFSQTRIATIDVYALFFTLLMFLFMLDFIELNRTEAPFIKKLIPLGLSGLSFGLGASSKWTCFYSGAGLAVLFFGSFILRTVDIIRERIHAKREGQPVKPVVINPVPALPVLFVIGAAGLFAAAKLSHASSGILYRWKYNLEWYDLLLNAKFWIPFLALCVLAVISAFLFRRFLIRGRELDLRYNEQLQTLVMCCVFFIVIPVILYFCCSYSFFLSENRNTLHAQLKFLWEKQLSMYRYHAGLDATHLCQSNWYQWPLAEKSVWFYAGYPDGKISNISSTGNPAVWYVSAFGAVLMAVEWCFRPECRKNKGFYVIFVGILAGLLPWTLVTRCVFLYHYFSTIPFMLLASVALLYYFEQRYPKLKPVKWIWLGIAVVFFILMYPAISGLPSSYAYAGFIEHVLTVFGKVYYVGV